MHVADGVHNAADQRLLNRALVQGRRLGATAGARERVPLSLEQTLRARIARVIEELPSACTQLGGTIKGERAVRGVGRLLVCVRGAAGIAAQIPVARLLDRVCVLGCTEGLRELAMQSAHPALCDQLVAEWRMRSW